MAKSKSKKPRLNRDALAENARNVGGATLCILFIIGLCSLPVFGAVGAMEDDYAEDREMEKRMLADLGRCGDAACREATIEDFEDRAASNNGWVVPLILAAFIFGCVGLMCILGVISVTKQEWQSLYTH